MNENLHKAYDGRYKNAGMNISEYDLQKENGVLTTLRNLPLYERYIPNDQKVKERVEYNFMTRELIPWKMTCEMQHNHTRKDVLTALENSGPTVNPISLLIRHYAGAIIFAAICMAVIVCCCSCSGDINMMLPIILCMLGLQFLVVMIVMRMQMTMMALDDGR